MPAAQLCTRINPLFIYNMYFSMKQILFSLLLLLVCPSLLAQDAAGWKALKGPLTFFIANDLGRNGYYEQRPLAELMGQMADVVGPECVFAAGDVHHFEGVASTADPLWTTNFELVYAHPELMIPWHPILGNHEYRGNTQAVLDYTHVSRRWEMPARYYTKTYTKKGVSIRFVLLDTTPLISRYRKEQDQYPDAAVQDDERQLAWVDSVLTAAKEQWVVVIGHHPIYAVTGKDTGERTDLQKRLDPILRRHHVDLYVAGHIHNFQHHRAQGSKIDYVVNSSASLARPIHEQPSASRTDGLQFASPSEGFAVVTATADKLRLAFIGKEGETLWSVER